MGNDSGVLVLHNVPLATDGVPNASCAEADTGVLAQVEAVERALDALGVPFRRAGVRDLGDLPAELATAPEPTVFNLVESLRGGSRDFTLVPAICRAFGKACTGGDAFCLAACFDKWQTKAALRAVEVPTPEAVLVPSSCQALPELPAGPLIVKPLLAEASEGIDADSVFEGPGPALREAVRRIHEQFGCAALVERFVRGRELNVSVLQRGASVEVLPLAEIEFGAFPPNMPQVVGYRAKWLSDTFEYRNTPRRIPADLPGEVAERVRVCARRAWDALGCEDYARVDFRLDADLRPYVLEVNSNPDISPDAGFVAALDAAGVPYAQFIEGMLTNARSRLAGARVGQRAVTPGGGAATPVIRWSLPEDRRAILDIAVQTRAFRPAEVAVAREVLDAALHSGPGGDYQSYTALVDGLPVGWACFGSTPCTRGTFDLYWIMVAPRAQGTGAGRALIARVEALIGERGGRLVIVEASGGPAGDRARGFYMRMGYEEAARVRDFYAPGDDKVIYVKRLVPTDRSGDA